VAARVRLSRNAARQIRSEATWWDRNRRDAPLAFLDDLAHMLELISLHPSIGARSRDLSGVRRVLLRSTGHFLYYQADPARTSVRVLALWHASRGAAPEL
jgi:plasmid stabilization system protein ParE